MTWGPLTGLLIAVLIYGSVATLIKTLLVFPFELLLRISPPQAAVYQPCLLLIGAGKAPEFGVVRGWEVQLRLWVLISRGEQSMTEFHLSWEAQLASSFVRSLIPSSFVFLLDHDLIPQ